MTRDFLIELGEKYCKQRPGSCLTDVDEKNNTITSYFCGALLTSNAFKVAEMLGIEIPVEEMAA